MPPPILKYHRANENEIREVLLAPDHLHPQNTQQAELDIVFHGEEESKTEATVLRTKLQLECPDQILEHTVTNSVLAFDYDSFDPKDKRQGCFDGQYSGNHFDRGITLSGFIRLMVIIGWESYEIQQRANHDLPWLDDSEKIGYDLTKIVIPAYMHKIRLPHLSLAEAIESGKVAELLCLKKSVGRADAFTSHVQKMSVATLIRSLEGAEVMYAEELGSEPKYFIDYVCIRQCLSGDFTLDRVIGAIETIGVTVAELDTDLTGDTALLHRTFCVLESFATIKAKGKLLVCGPALQDRTKTLELAKLAADPERHKEVIDCATSKCRWEDEAVKIKNYIVTSVGYDRTDKVVLAAIVQSCIRKAADIFEELEDGGASVLHDVGVMLFKVGDYDGALVPLKQALAKEEAVYGEGALEIVNTVFMIAQCYWKMDERSKEWYERALRVNEQHYGADHVATARYLVGISRSYKQVFWIQQPSCVCSTTNTGLKYVKEAIALIEAAESPDQHLETHADALHEIGLAYQSRARASCIGGAGSDPKSPLGVRFFSLMMAISILVLAYHLAFVWATPLPRILTKIFGVSLFALGSFPLLSFPLNRWHTNHAIGYYQRSIRLRETRHGQSDVTTADCLRSLAEARRDLLQPAKELQLLMQVREIEDRTKGPLSAEVGLTCLSIGKRHTLNLCWSASVPYYKRALESAAFTLGREHERTGQCRAALSSSVAMMMFFSCCSICGRGHYLDEIKEHDRWLEEEARKRGKNAQAWRRVVQGHRRKVWFVNIAEAGYPAIFVVLMVLLFWDWDSVFSGLFREHTTVTAVIFWSLVGVMLVLLVDWRGVLLVGSERTTVGKKNGSQDILS
jgi:tetratricopeptide (TPR) repeat protein